MPSTKIEPTHRDRADVAACNLSTRLSDAGDRKHLGGYLELDGAWFVVVTGFVGGAFAHELEDVEAFLKEGANAPYSVSDYRDALLPIPDLELAVAAYVREGWRLLKAPGAPVLEDDQIELLDLAEKNYPRSPS